MESTNTSECCTLSWISCSKRHKCVTPRAAMIALFWNFMASLIFNFFHLAVTIEAISKFNWDEIVSTYFFFALYFCFYPLAGCLADIKLGRYRSIYWSLHIVAVISVLTVILQVPWYILEYVYTSSSTTLNILFYGVAVWIFLLACVGIIFGANIIQFGMDQLHDSPSDHQSLFIHWYYWTQNAGLFTIQVISYVSFILPVSEYSLVSLLFTVVFLFSVFLIISLWVAHCQRKHFLIDSKLFNPYKLVYKVTRFACNHRSPVRRSAFTYCEDNIPSGLNLCKTKYGGPFTTEQVEDVKAFYGTWKVLLAVGPLFFIGIAAHCALYNYYRHIQNHSFTYYSSTVFHGNLYLLGYGLLSSIIIIIFIPLYIHFVRPFIFYRIPGMLKRIGLGYVFIIFSLIFVFLMDLLTHLNGNTSCMFQSNFSQNSSTENSSLTANILIVPWILSSCFKMLIYVALFEFICSQSPQSMKGLLIGLCFAIKGIFELFGIVLIILFTRFAKPKALPSCGMIYYLINICIGIVAAVLYTRTARNYQYRMRDEPCLVHRYVEDYYSKIQDERLYDYSDKIY